MSYQSSLKDELNRSIDFQQVLEQVARFASFECSKKMILEAVPMQDFYEIQYQLDLTKEAFVRIQNDQDCPMSITDIEMPLKRSLKHMTLTPKELSEVLVFMISVRQVKKSLEDKDYERLYDLGQSLSAYPKLIKAMQEQIDSSGAIKENATPYLLQKHHEVIDSKARLQEKARHFLKRNGTKLMENTTTLFQSRVTFLVKAQDKNSFGGMVHGQSQSGLAYYVEPQEFVVENNHLQLLYSQIEEEKNRICTELTKQVKEVAHHLLSDLETMTLVDVTFTKARWAYQFDGCIPRIQTRDHTMLLEEARHPLIAQDKVVSNTYRLRKDQYCLMISGPNMGGKTVTLKTIGLFVCLSHAGFPVLCHNASIPFYRSIWIDIGDNQSIENNLSTFSSHISKISMICQNCNQDSFILLDEVGNGTDPLEGASLATAILEYLILKQCTVITSTHYSQVKAFGKTNPNVLVSSVEFDPELLKPTYRYIEGISGASYAFLIASQYQLQDSILERASVLKDENEQNVEKELARLETLQNEVLKEKERFHALIKDAHRIQKEANELQAKLSEKKKELDETYHQQLSELLLSKEKEAKDIIRKLKKNHQGKQHEQTELLHQMNSLQDSVQESENTSHTFKLHDYVQIVGLNSHGEIIDIRKKEATVDTNGMKMKVKLNQLRPMKKPQVQFIPSKRQERVFKRFPLELNIIGCRVEEGLKELDHYIDQAVASHVKQVRIIHGMGTGVLRSAVWKDLNQHPQVKELTSAGASDGGLGATIVTLK